MSDSHSKPLSDKNSGVIPVFLSENWLFFISSFYTFPVRVQGGVTWTMFN